MESDTTSDLDDQYWQAAGNNSGPDLSNIRGIPNNTRDDVGSETDLENLAELVPDIKNRRGRPHHTHSRHEGILIDEEGGVEELHPPKQHQRMQHHSSGHFTAPAGPVIEPHRVSNRVVPPERSAAMATGATNNTMGVDGMNPQPGMSSSDSEKHREYGDLDDYAGSDHIIEDEGIEMNHEGVPKEFMNMSSAQSISTATQTHEVRMPMYLPTFKPATGCTNASDFIVRCFVARLRCGITVVKHGRSRWCKSRLRVLHIHPDGRSLSWKPADGEPPSSRRPPKLDLSMCLEVRHAWSPDPQNPMYTGTPILRQKCEAANAHKSFALIFKTRTVDITAVTADQCKVLMEGFSALCFRLQVASLAGRNGQKKNHQARPMPEEDGVSTTASATLTNRSNPRGGLS